MTAVWLAAVWLLMATGAGTVRVEAAAANFPALQAGQDQEEPAVQAPNPAAGPRVAVHGMVKNAISGEPLPRALVRIEGDAAAGALTDGDGRFEITGVPVGGQAFQVVKPGYRDVSAGFTRAVETAAASNSEHNVHVTADMAELVFLLAPTNSIRGQIELSTGDPAQGIGVMLLRRSVQDGRAVWQAATNTRTNSDGAYRFAGLADGVYALYTEPAMDSDLAVSLVEGGTRPITRAGYPSTFYPDARDVAGAAKIPLSGGQQAQANMLLPEEPFHLVRATVTRPGQSAQGSDDKTNMGIMVLDAQGHQVPYSAEYDRAANAIQAFLPDGTYSLYATAMSPPTFDRVNGRFTPSQPAERQLAGQVEFTVSGHPVTKLRMGLAAEHPNTVQVSLLRTNPQGTQDSSSQGSPIVVMLSQAGGWITDGMVSAYAEGYVSGPIETVPMGPGTYWAHTNIPQRGLCESSFTAGGASLAREPLVLGASGVSAPLTLTLRDDCATLKLSLPPSVDQTVAGDEAYYTVYVVPEFDSTADVTPITLRPSSGGNITVAGLTPGAYHVFVFNEPVELEYHNPEAIAQMGVQGQEVTLPPSGTASLVLEVPKQ